MRVGPNCPELEMVESASNGVEQACRRFNLLGGGVPIGEGLLNRAAPLRRDNSRWMLHHYDQLRIAVSSRGAKSRS